MSSANPIVADHLMERTAGALGAAEEGFPAMSAAPANLTRLLETV